MSSLVELAFRQAFPYKTHFIFRFYVVRRTSSEHGHILDQVVRIFDQVVRIFVVVLEWKRNIDRAGLFKKKKWAQRT